MQKVLPNLAYPLGVSKQISSTKQVTRLVSCKWPTCGTSWSKPNIFPNVILALRMWNNGISKKESIILVYFICNMYIHSIF